MTDDGFVAAWGRARICAGALVAGGMISGASASEAPEAHFFAEVPVVLSVSRLPQSQFDVPGAVTVFDRETIRATGYRNIADLLRLVPGFQVSWLRGWWGVAGYHGLAGEFANRMLLVVDGRPVNSEFFTGGIDWNSLPLDIDDIERIEVLRGSNSTNYGTNAYLGVVDIRTRPASDGDGVDTRISAGNGVADASLHATLAGERGALRFNVRRSSDTGLDQLADDSKFNALGMRADLRLGPVDDLLVNLGVLHSRAGEGYATDPWNSLRDRFTETDFAQLRWRRTLDDDGEFWVQFYRNRERYTDVVGLPLEPPAEFDLNRHASRTSFEFQHRRSLASELRMVWGGELRRDTMSSRILFGHFGDVPSRTLRLSGNLEWRPTPGLMINGGAMAERVRDLPTDISPRLFVNFEAVPGQVLRAGYSTASRAATIYEANANMNSTASGLALDRFVVGNPRLLPERATVRELGYFGRPFGRLLDLDLRFYQERLSRLVGQVQIAAPTVAVPGGTNSWDNLETARLTGIDVQVRLQPREGTQILVGHNYQRTEHRNLKTRRSAPVNSTSLVWIERLDPSLTLSVMHFRVREIQWLEFGDLIPRYRRTDVRLAQGFRSGDLKGELALVGQNLFDRYPEFRIGNPGEEQVFSRRLFLTLRLDY